MFDDVADPAQVEPLPPRDRLERGADHRPAGSLHADGAVRVRLGPLSAAEAARCSARPRP
ncbi:hypothetical protein Q5425_36045 [Amycolatopsis sp. A133]|uniref:hypothetical protein n=1 Tax=Amycolatopsis sp. A133 TaxID=3064472 RepID=UPI0027FAA1DE|nr:hypothetical protein [Amycolatopsis sp. A133]MDQ7809168.1 hypothetical protein [Amycolatopsis sp. A133]